MVGRVGF